MASEPVRFNTNFEGASLGTVEVLGESSFRCHVKGQQDERGRNRQASWYFFRMDGVRDRDLTLTMTDFVGEYDGKPGACPMGPEIVPVFSNDGEHWREVPSVSWDDRAKEATIRLRAEADSVWIAHQPPYTTRRLARLLEEVDHCDDARVEVIGKTVQGRDLHLITVTDADVPDRDKVTVWLQARQHAWESGTSFVMEGALRFVISDDPAARALRRRAVFKFTPMVDPDGCANGQVRFNANGFDVNRHWDEVDLRQKRFLARMPEIWYVKKAIHHHLATVGPIALMVNLHNTETGEYLQTSAGDAASRVVVARLDRRLTQEAGFHPSYGPVVGAPKDGTANSLNPEAGVLVLLMERRIARDPRTRRPPTPDDRLAFGAQLIRIMAESARP
ncbi:MAG TPA: M14-type cytosolic carboxypeptidase [Isosphaeraceae bacterium]|nr:M14-type cytosolic carboxypeptidase [Isosphaeraceae bacterium]